MENEKKPHHPAFEYLTKDPSLGKCIFMFIGIVLIGPFFEEFLFRFVLQGWLDSRERERFGLSRFHRRFQNRFHSAGSEEHSTRQDSAEKRPVIRHRTNCSGWRSLILVAILFSLLHFHSAADTYPSESELQLQFLCQFVSYLVILLLSFSLLRFRDGFSWRQMGLDLSHWKTDLLLGAFFFFCIAPISYLCQFLLTEPLKGICTPDFISLIPLALGFGFLYMRTRRLLPGSIMHALFNGFALAMFILCQILAPELGMVLVPLFW